MNLTDPQQRLLDGNRGEMVRRLMRLLVRLGEAFGAERLVEIVSAQVSGVSFKSIGAPGLAFLEDVAAQGARVAVPTTLNPAGMDLENWRTLGVPEDFAEKQNRIIAAFEQMGVTATVTCTPYYAGNVPRRGEHVAWAESSAVSFANSVLGARTNREGGPSALAAAVCGCTPCHGLHLDAGRRPTIRVAVGTVLESRADFGALGHYVGRRVRDGVPYFTGIPAASWDDLKSLGAAMAASGAVGLYHVENLTPEAHLHDAEGLESIAVTRTDLDETYERLSGEAAPDLLVLGCPHASLEEIGELAERLEGRQLTTPLWICTSRAVKKAAAARGLVRIIEDAGGRVVADTCMVVSPIEQMGFTCCAVDSGKAAHYLPGFCKQNVVFGDLDSLLGKALS